VQDLIKEHGTNNPFKIAKHRNIELIFEDLQHIYGYYLYCRRVQIIHINCILKEFIQKYVCVHELGNAVRHTDDNTAFLSKNNLFSTDKFEIEANTFAVELLYQMMKFTIICILDILLNKLHAFTVYLSNSYNLKLSIFPELK